MTASEEYAEKELLRIEALILKEYETAYKDLLLIILDYMRRFVLKDQKWEQWVKEGKKTEEDHRNWRIGQFVVGKKWENLKKQMSIDMFHSNLNARAIISENLGAIYGENFNFQTYQLEKESGLDTFFQIYNRDSFNYIAANDPDLLPPPGKKLADQIKKKLDEGIDIRWNKKTIQSVMMQGILQGMSIPHLSEHLAEAVNDTNKKAATRNARTMATGAYNAGANSAYIRAQNHGLNIKKTWVATLDMRTRHTHRLLDGVTVDVDQPFETEFGKIQYPGDPAADPADVFNCRCTTISQLKGYKIDVQGFKNRNDPNVEGMSYEEWKKSKKVISKPIMSQKKKSERIRAARVAEYRR